jgi:hypothetical protein
MRVFKIIICETTFLLLHKKYEVDVNFIFF